jgi:hypothetical protein
VGGTCIALCLISDGELASLADLNKLMKRHKVQVIDFPRRPWQETNLVQKMHQAAQMGIDL